ncbi:MAG: hypothetical protein HY235_00370 [Acidobacteria bacterium]|nr:hypothetical protein [Acidobacteriota bacterium]
MFGTRIITGSLFCALAAFAQQPDYFPLQVRNQWIYRSGGAFGVADPLVVEVTGARAIAGNEYFTISGFPGGAILARKNDTDTLVFYDQRTEGEKPWIAFGAATGDSFRSQVHPCNTSGVIQTRDGKLRSPIGEFSNALEARYVVSNCADAGITSEAFLPEVGLAQRRYSTIAGERIYELIYARVSGFTVFSEKEISFGLTLDAAVYPPAGAITARLTLRNTQDQPLRLMFPSGQDYDLVIRNQMGEEVHRWSRGRAFPLVFRTWDFSGERNWVVLDALGGRGSALAPGNYTATASLAVSGAVYEASVGFAVRAAQ